MREKSSETGQFIRLEIPVDVLYELYVVQNKSTTAIGRHFNCSRNTICRNLRAAGIPLKPIGGRVGSDGKRVQEDDRRGIRGKTFGRLTVIQVHGRVQCKGVDKYIVWECECECGNRVNIPAQSLLRGVTTSCGCFRTEQVVDRNWTGYMEIPGYHWSNIQRSAADRGIEFNITIEQVWDLYCEQNRCCKLTGLPIRFKTKGDKKSKGTASLDRIDSKKGYVIDNVAWVHKDINRSKWDFTLERYLEMCQQVTSHMSKPSDN